MPHEVVRQRIMYLVENSGVYPIEKPVTREMAITLALVLGILQVVITTIGFWLSGAS